MSELTEATASERHRILAERFLDVADGVSDWDAPTPVKEWRTRDVVEHLTWLPGMLSGMGVDLQIPQADSSVDQLRAQTARVQEVLDGPEGEQVIDSQMLGMMPLTQVIDLFYNADLSLHAWDLARGSGQDLVLDEDYASANYEGMYGMGPALHASGQFGTPQPVADDAPIQDRLIAYIGRDPAWTL